ncbi:hypothetical protein G9P44_002212 [Scheffersomyces stipitis]|nr:hypothetical protein G9P44_002212 [Scheffersomyces stipitis]
MNIMNVQSLRNLIALRTRNISKRIQRALQELSENLANEQPQPQAVPIPVRARNPRQFRGGQSNFYRFYGSFTGFGAAGAHSGGPNWAFHKLNSNNYTFFNKHKMFSKFYNTSNHGSSKIFSKLHHGSMFHNFSSAYQSSFRLKLYQQNVRLTYRTLLCQFKDKFNTNNLENSRKGNLFKFNPSKNINHTIRLNLSLTPNHHQVTLQLARTDSSATQQEKMEADQVIVGCYMDFPISFNLNIPTETLLSEEIMDEMLDNIKRFEKQLSDLKSDLKNLFELGELPIKYISGKNVLRVFFPNCDRGKLDSLCREKNITGGVIYEDVEGMGSSISEPPVLSSTSCSASSSNAVTETDILSSYYDSHESHNSTVSSFGSEQDYEMFSDSDMHHPISNEEIVRLDGIIPEAEFQFQVPQFSMEPQVNFNDYDDYYWATR